MRSRGIAQAYLQAMKQRSTSLEAFESIGLAKRRESTIMRGEQWVHTSTTTPTATLSHGLSSLALMEGLVRYSIISTKLKKKRDEFVRIEYDSDTQIFRLYILLFFVFPWVSCYVEQIPFAIFFSLYSIYVPVPVLVTVQRQTRLYLIQSSTKLLLELDKQSCLRVLTRYVRLPSIVSERQFL